MSDSIKIEPIKLKEFDVKQSNYDVAPKIPFSSDLRTVREWQNNFTTESDTEHIQKMFQ